MHHERPLLGRRSGKRSCPQCPTLANFLLPTAPTSVCPLQLYVEEFAIIVNLLRMADGNIPCAGKIYHECWKVQQTLEASAGLSALQKWPLLAAWRRRWDMLHIDLHSAAYMLDPEFAKHNIEDIDGEVCT